LSVEQDYFKGRGAQIKTENRFLKAQYVTEHIEGLDEPLLEAPHTQIFIENPKKIVNKVESPDLQGMYSMNPYQGCEHGCIYCSRGASMVAFIVMRATHMSITALALGLILKVKSLLRKMPRYFSKNIC